MGFTAAQHEQWCEKRRAEYRESLQAHGGATNAARVKDEDWSAWKPQNEDSSQPTLNDAPTSEPSYRTTDLRDYLQLMVERSEVPEAIFAYLRINAVHERKFIRLVYSGVIKDELDSFVVRFEALRQNPSSEYVFLSLILKIQQLILDRDRPRESRDEAHVYSMYI